MNYANPHPLGSRENPIFFRYSVKQILDLRKRLLYVLDPFINKKVTKDILQPLAEELWRALSSTMEGSSSVLVDTIYQSILDQFDQELTPARAGYISEYLAGNLPRLRAGEVLVPWNVLQKYEWVPIQLNSVVVNRSKTGELGAFVTQKIIGGSAAPLLVTTWWSLRKCKTLAYKYFGFSRRRNREYDYTFQHPNQLVSLRFYGLLNPERSKDKPYIESVYLSPSMRRWNRTMIELRNRVKFRCPLNLPKSVPCYRCHMGYAYINKERCSIACHRTTMELKYCDVCKKSAYWDKDNKNSIMCYNCSINKINDAMQKELVQ